MDRLKTFEEISEEIHEERLGIEKRFTARNGYYLASLRGASPLPMLKDTKIGAMLSFKGANQPNSFGYFKSKAGYNSSYKNNKDYANHYGEYIASIILKQLGIKACKVDIGTFEMVNRYSKKNMEIPGILSHFQLSLEQIFMPICTIIEKYQMAHPKKYKELTKANTDIGVFGNKNYGNIEVILASIESELKEAGQSRKIAEMREKFFDMCIFDIKFANRDRHDDNFGLRIDQQTGDIDFYPLFDNEQILGLQEERKNVEKYLRNDKEYNSFKKNNLTSYIGIPDKPSAIPPMELLKYLLEKYPTETKRSLEKFEKFKTEDLQRVMDLCPNLSEPHKALAVKIFEDREKEIASTIKLHEDKINSVGEQR